MTPNEEDIVERALNILLDSLIKMEVLQPKKEMTQESRDNLVNEIILSL